MRQCIGMGLAQSQECNRHSTDSDKTESGDAAKQAIGALFLQVLKYGGEERKERNEGGREGSGG